MTVSRTRTPFDGEENVIVNVRRLLTALASEQQRSVACVARATRHHDRRAVFLVKSAYLAQRETPRWRSNTYAARVGGSV